MNTTVTLNAEGDDILQMKMITGETVLTAFSPKNELVEDSFILICTLEMIPMETYEDIEVGEMGNTEYYILRPWVTYSEDMGMEISVNPTNVVYMTEPSKGLKKQYFRSLDEIQKQLGKNKEEKKDEDKNEESTPSKVGDVIAFKPRIVDSVLLTED